MSKKAVVYIAWGKKYIDEVFNSIEKSEMLRDYDIILITDQHSEIKKPQIFSKIIRASFKTEGLLRKSEMVHYLPDNYDCFLYLDSDTVVLKNIDFGFKKAWIHDIAMSPAPLYSLSYFWGFDEILEAENIESEGQLLYNSGVIFFKNSSRVKQLFNQWKNLAEKYAHSKHGDQPFLTLAIEQLNFNPYTLSRSFNYRGIGEYLIGPVRIWHSRGTIPENINENVNQWPPRRAWPSKVKYFSQKKNIIGRNKDRLIRFFKKNKLYG